MAGQVKNLKVKGGRFYARVAVPAHLRQIIGKTELVKPLGGERRAAMKALPAAVATLQRQIATAEATTAGDRLDDLRTPITTEDFSRAIWQRYSDMLAEDEQTRARYPTPDQIGAATDRAIKRIQKDGIDTSDPLAMLDAALEVHVLKGAREFDQNTRKARLDALRKDLAADRTHPAEHEIAAYLDRHSLTAPEGSAERATLAKRIMRAEIEALQRTLERDRGDYGGKPADPVVSPPAAAAAPLEPVPIKKLFKDYIASRQALGKHKDGAKAWETAVLHLIKFLGHSDARRITKRNLLDWRDKLVAEKKSTKTIADKYLASVRAMLRWAHENDLLPTNEAEAVRQEVAKKRRTREAGYTDAEAIAVLKASTGYQPKATDNPAHRESAHITDAKRWVPLLCAFTGARVSEMTQLRKEDLRQEGDRWVIRITPDAGSVKTGDFRDVPLHKQVISMGFADFVRTARAGPLFHGGKTPARFLASARGTSGRISQWLQDLDLVPDGVQPSHAWRHRFKTLARDIGADSRVVDAIQGHAGRTASDDYGDVSLIAKARVIDALPDYNIE
ncbi:DUF6538 domain-containing protein [Paracoccus aminovorans]|uniref:DUF6538 domain-containing protein n=1 Tax=Paracoccus aminovorans TaxID=34004 RepID=UPI000A4CAF5F|nr:DUF6538 domain-containing protein [Paracoccus aminovorans]